MGRHLLPPRTSRFNLFGTTLISTQHTPAALETTISTPEPIHPDADGAHGHARETLRSFTLIATVSALSFALLGVVWGILLPTVAITFNADGTDYELVGNADPAIVLNTRMQGLALYLLGVGVLSAGIALLALSLTWFRRNAMATWFLALVTGAGAYLTHMVGMHIAYWRHPVPEPGTTGSIVQPVYIGSWLLLAPLITCFVYWFTLAVLGLRMEGVSGSYNDRGISLTAQPQPEEPGQQHVADHSLSRKDE